MLLNFSVSGDFLTKTARGFVLEKDFERAVEFLSNSVAGFPIDYVIKVLLGKARLTGVNDLNYEESDNLVYQQELAKIVAGIYKFERGFYRPYACVTNLGKNDIVRIDHARVPLENDGWAKNWSYRYWHYVDDLNNDLVVTLDKCLGNKNQIHAVLFKKVDVPFWLRSSNVISVDPQVAVEGYLESGLRLEERGHGQKYDGYESGFLGGARVAPEAIIDKKEESDEDYIAARICRDYSLRLGWLSPNGVFYACGYSEHSDLAASLCRVFFKGESVANGAEALLERRKWIKLLQTLDCNVPFFYFAHFEARVTLKQRSAIVNWCGKNAQELPSFLSE